MSTIMTVCVYECVQKLSLTLCLLSAGPVHRKQAVTVRLLIDN